MTKPVVAAPAGAASSSVSAPTRSVQRRTRTPCLGYPDATLARIEMSAHDQHVARRVAHEPLRDRSHEEALERVLAAASNHDQARGALLGGLDDLRRRVPGREDALDVCAARREHAPRLLEVAPGLRRIVPGIGVLLGVRRLD